MKDREKEILDSLRGMEKAQPSPLLFDKISRRIAKDKAEPAAYSWAAAAAVLLIVGLNAFSVAGYFSSSEPVSEKAAYTELVSNFNIYD